MKRPLLTLLFLLMIAVWLPNAAMAQTWPDTLLLEFDFDGFGNAILNSPVQYSGTIYAGDPRVLNGTWVVEVDDTGWPSTSDPEARWTFLFNNYYVFDGFAWTARFGENPPEKPTWEIVTPTNGSLGGTLIAVISFSDWDMDGILDLEERMFGVFSGTLMVMKYGTGNFAKYCGNGSYNGSLQNPDPANFADDYVEGHCLLNLINCEVPVRADSWSHLKLLYR
jgi:hypothetical protein